MYTYGMRFDVDSNALTTIDEDAKTAVTVGSINSDDLIRFVPAANVEKEYEVSTTSTTSIDVGEFTIPKADIINKLWVIGIEDVDGPRDGYFFAWVNARYGTNGTVGAYYKGVDGGLTGNTFATLANSKMGVYALVTVGDNDVTIKIEAVYDSTKSSDIDGTYKVRLFIM